MSQNYESLEWMSKQLRKVFHTAIDKLFDRRGQFMTASHFLYEIFSQKTLKKKFESIVSIEDLKEAADAEFEPTPETVDYQGVELGYDLDQDFQNLYDIYKSIDHEISIDLLLFYYLYTNNDFCCYLSSTFDFFSKLQLKELTATQVSEFMDKLESYGSANEELFEEDKEIPLEDNKDSFSEFLQNFAQLGVHELKYDSEHAFIGRKDELERAVQVLCRLDKGNVMFIGESGVGKTAMVRGLLAEFKDNDKIPERLKNSRIVELSVASVLGNSQFQGDLEKNLITMFDVLASLRNAILFIDDIHTIVGAGKTDKSSIDASAIIRPYLNSGKVKVIGCTTYEEHKKTLLNNKPFDSCFTKIDIAEPSIADAVAIVEGVKSRYEKHHNVVYSNEIVRFIVENTAKYINDKCLPSKAVDMLDEVGAKCEFIDASANGVTKELVKDTLSKICKVAILSDNEDESIRVEKLEERISGEVFGQAEAVKEVCESILMSQAGLQDDDKPMACLLFVGPTGVGKTETAKVLAKQLGVSFLKYDMSEYSEKHSVSKLIGSPSGYVGYDDGGQLTDAVRKNPHCVLLLDELEKAHSDIYNILLQIMDYATLTDNKGVKVDFRHVILIMTTNAGARFARSANSGFLKSVSAGEAMMSEVKKTFSPEFINRLTAINVFKDMDRDMASLILDKKIRNLEKKLMAKNVKLNMSSEAHDLMLDKGYSVEYGGRNIERTVNDMLKSLLMREILFGCLKNGGNANVGVENDKLTISNN